MRDEWLPETARTAKAAPITFGAYAESWLKRRDLKARTADHYRAVLDKFILPRFGEQPVVAITPTDVADWNHDLGTKTGPTHRAHAYSLVRSICLTAVDEDVLTASPCRVRGAGAVRKGARKIEPATLGELESLTTAMPAPLRAAVLLAAWCALRFGEITELRRKDVARPAPDPVIENTTGQTWRNIRHDLDRLHLVTLATVEGRVAQRTTLTPGHKTILKAPELDEPRRFYDFTTPTA